MGLVWWWHDHVLKHEYTATRITAPLADTSRRLLVKCDCGKVWAL